MITVTVTGPPKSGKSTLINIIQDNIKVPARIKYRIVERRTNKRAKVRKKAVCLETRLWT
jgi:nicotinamide riboside kinase